MMVRLLTVMILLVAMAPQTFSKAVIVLDYYSNTAAFAKNCENKAKPVLGCHGKCQMMKTLKGEGKKEQDNPQKKAEIQNHVLDANSFFGELTLILFSHQTNAADLYLACIPVDRAYTIFHPPA
jgi:hypothetical protein